VVAVANEGVQQVADACCLHGGHEHTREAVWNVGELWDASLPWHHCGSLLIHTVIEDQALSLSRDDCCPDYIYTLSHKPCL
jgi:hypothetical protein